MEYGGNSEDLAVAAMFVAAGVSCTWLLTHFAVPGLVEAREMPILLLAAGLGSALAGLLVAPWFGQRGVGGWTLAALAALVATALGATIGGAVFYGLELWLYPGHAVAVAERDGLKIALAAGLFVFAAFEVPAVGGPWLAMMAGIQVISRLLRRARPMRRR